MKKVLRVALAIFSLAIIGSATSTAQNSNQSAEQELVTGIVVDKYDSPIPGVLVERKGSSKKHFVSTVTSVDGTFSLPASRKLKNLRFVYGGYRSENKHVEPEMHVKLSQNKLTFSNHWLISAQLVQADDKLFKPSIGLMIGWSGKVGLYAKAASTKPFYSSTNNSYFAWGYYEVIGGKVGKRDFNYTSYTAGLLIRLCKQIYLYGGSGYAEKECYYKFIGHKDTIFNPEGSFHSVAFDAGIILNLKGFQLSGGCIYSPDQKFYGNIGIGFCI